MLLDFWSGEFVDGLQHHPDDEIAQSGVIAG
jgi:hypothetical protein